MIKKGPSQTSMFKPMAAILFCNMSVDWQFGCAFVIFGNFGNYRLLKVSIITKANSATKGYYRLLQGNYSYYRLLLVTTSYCC